VREMGQSAWLSTSCPTLQGTEGESQSENGRSRLQPTPAVTSPTRPDSAETVSPPRDAPCPSKAAASEEARRYLPDFVEPFALAQNLGERRSLYRVSDFREPPTQR
jgi:hypothetical protein